VIRTDAARASLLSQTRALLHAHGLRPRRRRGQHFLVDSGVRDRIVAAAGLAADSLVVEIGPGTGILTEALLRTGARVLAVEVDRELALLLCERLAGNPRLTIRSADALEFDFAQALHDDPRRGRARVVANIPYYITTPLILRLVRHRDLFESLFLTVQREVAERLTAAPGRKSYGSLTLACQYRASIRSVEAIPRTAFHPVPEVDSALVRFDLLEAPRVRVAEPRQLFAVIRAAFGVRRKTLRNALCRAGWPARDVEDALDRVGVAALRRGETLTLDEFARLSDALPARASGDRAPAGDRDRGEDEES
jgi:16S rRNA (adenine1518-N6/adenine1519-N6)-dimethyltransferase